MSPHNFNIGALLPGQNYSEFASKLSMDTVFTLSEVEREAFLHQIMHLFGCTYICLWSYLPHPSNCLLFLDGEYREVGDQPSGNLGKNFYDAYRGLMHDVDSGQIPGLAFKNKVTYMELKLHDLQRMASHELQIQFYHEARIQMVVFMGCDLGEIELGLSHDPRASLQADMEMETRSLFPLNSVQQSGPLDQPIPSSSLNQNQPPPSSSWSSSSFKSLPVNSTQYSNSPLLFSSMLSVPLIQENINHELLNDVIKSSSSPISVSTTKVHGEEDDGMRRALNLAFLSSSSPSTSSSSQSLAKPITAFSSYNQRSSSSSSILISNLGVRTRGNNMFKKAVSFFRNLNVIRRQELLSVQQNQPTHAQMHHMISERRRREKINESFQVLRSLLPPGSKKKDKASVLSKTTEYLRSLKSQVQELSKINQMLECTDQLSAQTSEGNGVLGSVYTMPERTSVEVSQVSTTTSTSEARFLDLRIHVRGESCVSMLDLVVGLLEILKQQRNVVSLYSMESNTTTIQSDQVHGIFVRLKIEGDEFDNSNFQEAVKRAVDDLNISRD